MVKISPRRFVDKGGRMRKTSTMFVAAIALCAVAALAVRVDAQQSAPAQNDSIAFQDHINAAKLLAADDLTGRNLLDCTMPPQSAAPTGKPVTAPPTKVFDQLYYLGTDIVASWALVTSGGIIQIDSLDNPEEAQRIIIGGYKELGLDPAQMKYLVLTHGHDDHYGGAKYLQDTYHPHVLMSTPDWDMLAKLHDSRPGFGPPPTRDMDIADGQKLTLGNTTLTFYLTPGHTPGTISFLVPVTDQGKPHLLSFWGGSALPRTLEPGAFEARATDMGLLIYKRSLERFIKIGEDGGADGFIANHPYRDQTFMDGKSDKITKNQMRKPGDPSPWIGRSTYIRYMMIALECNEAQIGWIQAGKPHVSP
jgi:metallo-beta-lactamase class B